MNNYCDSLSEFKKSLKGGSEFEILIDSILKSISTNRIRWFDVGIGDGHYLKKIVMRLEELGFVVDVSGVDVCEESVNEARKTFPAGNIHLGDFSKLVLDKKYDVFMFNQSIYYFDDKVAVLNKSEKHLAEGGLLIGVSWSESDALFKFHKSIFGNSKSGAFNSRAFRNLISKTNNLKVFSEDFFQGTVDFELWKNDDFFEKGVQVISRIPVEGAISDKKHELARKMLHNSGPKEPRINSVIIGKKSYEIPNFTRGRINEILVNRFPSHQDKVPKIKGDLEALFMGSWERETEYLADYIAPGRVLEICCASGLKSVILAQKHSVVAIDINLDRLDSAKHNSFLFGVGDRIEFKEIDAMKVEEIEKMGGFDAIYIDVDWRENLCDPIKKQNINPFKTCPRTDKLYLKLRKTYPQVPIIFKVSPFVRVQDLCDLDICVIEELFIDGKFLSYNVYFDPKISKSRWQQIHLFNRDSLNKK